MGVAETNARAFRLALAMDRMAEMGVNASFAKPPARGYVWSVAVDGESFEASSADSLAEAVGRLWERREQRLKTEKEQSNDDQK